MHIPDALPVLPLRETVIYPMVVAPILVGQERSLRLVNDVTNGNRLAALVAQRNVERRPAMPEDLYRVGTMAMIHELTRGQDNTLRIAVQGLERIRIVDYVRTDPYLTARIQWAPDFEERGVEIEALTRTARELFVELVGIVPELSDELAIVVQALGEPRQLAYLVASSAPLSTAIRQEVLEMDSVSAKLRRLIEILQHELAVRQIMHKISAQTSADMSKAQREHILRKQMESIQRELGEVEPELAESRELHEKLEATALSDEARKEAQRELGRLDRTPSISPEHGMIRTYLEWLLKLPWGVHTGKPIDVAGARKELDEDHFGLERIKDRIVEHLAVKRLREERDAEIAGGIPASASTVITPAKTHVRAEPILCFLGPPGVGKTSLGQSIALAMGRKFVRVSLGGIHDEAEIRGHRRTYIGAMPGRIIQAIARADAADPVFMLDEVDKLGTGFHGDPAAALLEVLDPAQNHAFVDTYLGVPFDLSRVLFICTANTSDAIPPALRDRMETLTIAGYTDAEKIHIAERHVLPKLMIENGLRLGEVRIEEPTIRRVVREYTREAGVRNLERELGSVLRKLARRIGDGAPSPILVLPEHLTEYLGPQRFYDEVSERIDRPGVATGLAWTPVGGEVLFVEATMMQADEERLVLTGMLGDVMRESAQAALSYLRTNAEHFALDAFAFQHKLVHVHVPAGAIPKDGPSAGVTMLVALASQLTGRPARSDLAVTGEITLRGKVLPVGGIKEKVLAAHRAGIHTVVIPRRNEGALDDVPLEVRSAIEFVLVDCADEVLSAALLPLPLPGAEVVETRPGEVPPPVH